MIKLDDHRKANLEMMFQGAQDRDLIHELVRRGRFKQIEVNASFWPEMKDADGYMDSVRKHASSMIARILAEDREAAPMLESVYPFPTGVAIEGEPASERKGLLTADIVVLVARKKTEN